MRNTIGTLKQKHSFNSPYFNHILSSFVEFEPCYIKEITSKFITKKKYVKVLGIVTNIRKRPKYVELTVDDNSDILRAIFWGSKTEFQESKLVRNYYTSSISPGTLVEARGIVDFYNNKAQLKLICLNNVYNSNVESLWWLRIFEKFKKEINEPAKPEGVCKELVKFISPFNRVGNYEVANKFNEIYFACMCRKCHKKTQDDELLASNALIYKVICRMVVSALTRFKNFFQDTEDNCLSEEEIHFIVNKILITNCNIHKILRNIPVSSN